MVDELPGITPMKWMTPEVSAAFPIVVAASLIESGLVRSRRDIQTLARCMEGREALLSEDHPRLTQQERNMVALLRVWLLHSLSEFVGDIEPDG